MKNKVSNVQTVSTLKAKQRQLNAYDSMPKATAEKPLKLVMTFKQGIAKMVNRK